MNKITRKRPVTMYWMARIYNKTGVRLSSEYGLKVTYKRYIKLLRRSFNYKFRKTGRCSTYFKNCDKFFMEVYDYVREVDSN